MIHAKAGSTNGSSQETEQSVSSTNNSMKSEIGKSDINQTCNVARPHTSKVQATIDNKLFYGTR